MSAFLTLFVVSACRLPDPGAPRKPRPVPIETATPAPSASPDPTSTPEPTTPTPTPVCTGDWTTKYWSIDAKKFRGTNIPEFEYSVLKPIFADPTVEITSVKLTFKVIGLQLHEFERDFAVDVNGIRTFAAGPPPLKAKVRNFFGLGAGDYEFDLGKIKLNGAEPFPVALRRIVHHKGKLILKIQGRWVLIHKMSLEITGRVGRTCTSPSPTPAPSPTPVPSPTPIPAPETSIDSVSPSASVTSSSTMTIHFNGDQAGLSFVCSLDSGPEAPCTSPAVYSDLGNGSHVFRVAAVNASGVRDETPAQYQWTVDRVPPGVTITNASSLPALSNAAHVSFEFSASKPSTFQCSMDNGAFSNCQSPASYFGLDEGAHLFRVRATDSLGNVSEPAQFGWSIDLTAPIVSLVDVIPPEPVTRQTSMTLIFTASESATFECNGVTCTSPHEVQGLADGVHTIEIRATDLAGNTGAAAAYSWKVDTVAPVLALANVIPAPGLTSAQAVSAEFESNESATYLCSWDGGAMEACHSPFQKDEVPDGLHELTIQAVDLAGNPSSPLSVQWVMDHTLPTLAWGTMLPSSASRINSTTFESAVIASEPVTLSCLLNGFTLPDTSSPIRVTGLGEGDHRLDVVGHDLAGNVSQPLVHEFTVDLTPPVVTLNQPLSDPTNRNNNTLSFFANEPATFECSFDEAGFAMCASPVTVSGLADGTHEFEVRAIDQAGNVGPAKSAEWTVDTTSPVATAVTVNFTSTSVTVNWTTSEPATSAVQWGPGNTTPHQTVEDSTLRTSHSVQITGLSPSTIYTVIPIGRDAAGNAYTSAKKQFRTSQ